MSAREIEDRAASYLLAREDAGWSEADQRALDAWLEESMAHKAAYWRLELGWRQADRIGALGPGIMSQSEYGDRQPGRWWKPLALAASLAAVIVTGALTLKPWRHGTVEVTQTRVDTPIGGHKLVDLSDGSTIELNTQTVLRTAVTAQGRDVWLDKGEAFFNVTHRNGMPFVVHAGSRTVTVLGTKFSVRRDGEKVIVSVLEGRVRVDDANAGKGPAAVITAGDTAIARGPSTLLTPRSPERVESALAWRDGMLTFDQSTLGEAASEFNRYNRKQLIVTDPDTAGIRIGGTFQASNIDAFARLLRDAYGLKVDTSAEAVKISS